MIAFAAPLGASALAALLIPLVIHLIRRRAARDIPFAALDWLVARTPPRRQWRLDQRRLLAVRLLLLALLAALLAEPQWRADDAAAGAGMVVVAPGIDAAAARAAVDAPLADWRWLAADAPSLDQPMPAARAPWPSLIRELDSRLPAGTPLTVVVPDLLTGLDGERLRLGRALDWRPLPAPLLPAPPATAAPALRVAIRAEGAAATVANALVAAWRASGQTLAVDAAPPGTPLAADAELLIAGGAVDAATRARIGAGMELLRGDADAASGEVLWRDPQGQPLLRRQMLGRGRIFVLAGPLDPAAFPALRDPQLPMRLLDLLAPPAPPPDRAPAASVAPLRAAVDRHGPATPLAPWLIVLIAAVALLERGLATRSGAPRE